MRKKLVLSLMAAALTTNALLPGLTMTALAEENSDYVTAQEWVESVTGDIDVEDALGHTYASAYYGLWNRTYMQGQETDRSTGEILVEGVEKSYAFYTPETWEAAGSCVYVFVPDGYTAEEFANESSWMQVAYDYGFTVAFLSDPSGAWDLNNLDEYLEYVIGVSTDLSSRSIVNYNESSLYVAGYGTGSTVANYATMNLANMFAGSVLFGTPEMTAEDVETVGNYEQFDAPLYGGYEREEGTVLKTINIPVWIINDGDSNEALEAYYKEANEVSDDVVYNDYAAIYTQDELFADPEADYESRSYVWVSDIEGAAEKYDYEFTAYAWENFLSRQLRLRSGQEGILYYNSAQKLEDLEYYDTEINGIKRYWAVYTPESYDGTTEMPAVLFIHGHAHGINGFFVNSGLWRAAEKYGFVLIYALGTPCGRDENVDCFNWNAYNDDVTAEYEYFNTLLDSVEENYAIDSTRIYSTSHSAGSEMNLMLAEEMPERFAGFGAVGCPYVNYSDEQLAAEQTVAYPFDVIYGTAESEYSEEKMETQVDRALSANDMDTEDEGVSYYNGVYTSTSYYDSESGMPLVKSYLWDDMIHTYLPEYFDAIWNDLCGYSRGEDGSLYYDGVLVK